MARVMRIVDDLDGSDADRTVVLALDGAVYALDLSEQNIGNLRKVLDPYLSAGRRIGKVDPDIMRKASVSAIVPASTAVRITSVAAPNSEIRAWAAANDLDCPARGQIPRQIREAYDKAHSH